MSDTYRACLTVPGGSGITVRYHNAITTGVERDAPRAYRRIHREIQEQIEETFLESAREILEEEMYRIRDTVEAVYMERYQELVNDEEARVDHRKDVMRRLERVGILLTVEETRTGLNSAFAGRLVI